MADAERVALRRLGVSYALAWATTSMAAGPGSAALVALSGRLSFAGMYVAVFYVSAAAGAALTGRAMDRYGRIRPLVAAHVASAIGFAVAGVGVFAQNAAQFVVGTTVLAAAFGGINLTRLLATEVVPAAERGRGIASVQLAAIAGAIAGPILLLLAEPVGRATGRAPLDLVWFFAPPLLAVSAFVAGRVRVPDAEPRASNGNVPATGAEIGASTGGVLHGTVALAASQAGMASVMGVAGAATAHAGHGVSVLGAVMVSHFTGMFAFSRIAGRVADRAGRRTTILWGLALLALGGGVVALTTSAAAFAIGLFVVGVGWSFGSIGSTLLVTDAAAPSTRARVLGKADLAAQLSAAAVAVGGGVWFARNGVAGLGLVAVIVAVVPVLLLVLRRPSFSRP